jgi:hypothetical protein
MTARLSETYRAGDWVEIVFDVHGDPQWLAGQVMGMQHPGLWVRLPGGSMWFVTNTRRIRPALKEPGPESE